MPIERSDHPAATLLHIGAGAGAEVADHLVAGATQIIVIEPDPKAAAQLARLGQDTPQLRVVPKAVAAQSGEAELRVYNMPGLASLTAPTADLLEIYPGLRVAARHTVTTLSPADLAAEIGEMTAPVRLILDAPGTEPDLLSAWQADGTLAKIDQIELRCGAAAMFEGGQSLADLTKRLESADFDQVSCDVSDPDWPVLHFAFNDLKQKLRQMSATASAAQERIGKLEGWLHGQKTIAEGEKTKASTAQARVTELEASLKSQKNLVEDEKTKVSTAQARIKDLEGWLEGQKTIAEDEKTKVSTAQARVTELEASLKSQKNLVEDEKTKVSTAQARIKDLEGWLEGQKTIAEGEKTKASAAQACVTALEKKHGDTTAMLSSTKENLDLTLRLQMMAANDLSDLQQRYSALSVAKEGQDLLLAQLVGRLEEASDYLQGLVVEDAPTTISVVEDTPPSETRPKKSKKRTSKARKDKK